MALFARVLYPAVQGVLNRFNLHAAVTPEFSANVDDGVLLKAEGVQNSILIQQIQPIW